MLAASFPPSLSKHSSTYPLDPTDIDETFRRQVTRILSSSGRHVDDISTRYFQGVHRWMSVIAPSCFLQSVSDFHSTALADFSILLLSVCLITSRPREPEGEMDQETLYLTTKMLFAHVQVVSPVSVTMIQAALLIAVYEWAQGLAEAAYISVGVCARLAFAAGLHEPSVPSKGPLPLYEVERRNVWWAALVWERCVKAKGRRCLIFDGPQTHRLRDGPG